MPESFTTNKSKEAEKGTKIGKAQTKNYKKGETTTVRSRPSLFKTGERKGIPLKKTSERDGKKCLVLLPPYFARQ
jgi:hypothetical protein